MFAFSELATVSSPLSMSPLSPLSPPFIIKNNPNTVYQAVTNVPVLSPVFSPVLALKPTYYVDIDTGINDNYIVQKDVTKYFMYKTLDKWLYNDFPYLLKYLKVEDGKVSVVKSESERDANSVKNDSESVLEAKSDFINEKILDEHTTREILIRIMRELGYKWFDLPYKETIVKDNIEGYIKRKLKNMLN